MTNSDWRFVLTVLLLASSPATTMALPWQPQVPELAEGDDDEDRFDLASTLFTDRKTSQAANAFREELAAGRDDKALVELSRMQAADPQLLVPMANGTWGPVFLNVLADFPLLPDSLQKRIVVGSSGIARNRLAELLESQDFQKLPEFWLRFPGTKESSQALLLMSRLQIDRGQTRAAEFWLKLVVDSGGPEFVSIAKRQLAQLTTNEDGDAAVGMKSPTAESISIFPRYADWSFRPAMSPVLREQVLTFRKTAIRDDVAVTSTWEPGFDSKRAYLRTLRGVTGIELDTGKSSWHYPISPPTEKLLQQGRLSNALQPFANVPPAVESFMRLDSSALASVFCRDEVQTHPVVSGGQVFVVATDADSTAPVANPSRLFGGPVANATPFRPGLLIALDAETGRRIWTVGRASLEQHLGPGDFGVWFYGPPCVMEHTVLSVFEWKGEIRMGKFSKETGQYLSSTPISLPEQSIDKDAVRTTWACTPIRDRGMVWSTTSTGWVLCLDESTMSVLWASRLAAESSLRSTQTVRRGRAAAITAMLPLNKRWNRSVLELSGNRMLVLSQESRDAILLDSRTGRRVKTLRAAGTNLLYSDDQLFLLLDGPNIRCFKMQDGEKVWEVASDFEKQSETGPSSVRPTGGGIRRDGYVLLPLSDGYLATVNLTSGEQKRGDSFLLPMNGWGRLEETPDGSLLYVAADQVTRLSHSKPSKPSIEHLSIGLELLAAGEPEKALQEARQIEKTDRDYRAAQKLEFDCLLQLSRTDSQQYLNQLRNVATSDMQQAQLIVLESEIQKDSGQHVEAITSICVLLRKPANVIRGPVASAVAEGLPVGQVQFPDGRIQIDRIEQTIRAWAVSGLSELLSQVDVEEWPLEELNSIPRRLLLGIDLPAAATLVREQVLKDSSRQLNFELFQHSVRLATLAGKETPDEYQNEIDVLQGILKQTLSEENALNGVPLPVTRHVLAVAISELPRPFVEAVKAAGIYDQWGLQWPDELRDEFERASQKWASEWVHDDWSVLPIHARYAQKDFGRARIADRDDDFLNHYQWGLTYGADGCFFVSPSIGAGQTIWNVALSETINQSQSRKEWVHRCGTVILLNSYQRLTAVSILDGDVLWSIPVQERVGFTHSHTFENFNVRTVSLLGAQRPPGGRLLTSGNGCFSIQGRDLIESRSLLTGDLLWQVSQSAFSSPVVAGPDGTLLFGGLDRKGLLVDVKTGQGQPANLNPLMQSRVMDYTDDKVVVWSQGGQVARGVTWVNPLTGDVVKSVSLAGFRLLQFVDSSLLAAISELGDLWFVNLKTGEVAKYRVPFGGDKFPGRVTERFVLASDRYVYVVFPSTNVNVRRRSPYLQAMATDGKLFVLDRKSGELISTVKTEDDALMLFEDPDFPLMMIGSQPNHEANEGPLVIQSYDVSGKRKQFDGRFPLNYGIRSLDYRINQKGSFDLMLDGSSFRIQAVDGKSDTPPKG